MMLKGDQTILFSLRNVRIACLSPWTIAFFLSTSCDDDRMKPAEQDGATALDGDVLEEDRGLDARPGELDPNSNVHDASMDDGSVSSDAHSMDGTMREADAGSRSDARTDLSQCSDDQVSLECVHALFAPLLATPTPFDATVVASAFAEHSTAVAPEWHLTAHHVLAASSQLPYGCFFEDYIYATSDASLRGPGCGEILMAGGHPVAKRCMQQSTSMAACVDLVPYQEAWDIVIARGPSTSTTLKLAARRPELGDEVFVVGAPSFKWLTAEERSTLQYPLLSRGTVLAVDGTGAILSAPVSYGSSGGPVLNVEGDIVGVLYTVIGDQRARGTPTPAWASDEYSVAVLINDATRNLLQRVRAPE